MPATKGNTDRFKIRKATQTDLPVLVGFLAKLALHVAGEPPRTLKEEEQKRLMAVLRSALSDSNKLLVVAEAPNTGLVGMGYIYVWRNQGIWEQAGDVEFKSGIIDDVWVEPDFRKLGVFSAILRELVSFAESHDIHELILEYAISNKEAAATWTKLGFKPTGVRAAAFTKTVQDALAKRRQARNL
ncbi:MAG: N-acetyltransferase family protein [Porticoccaceae bacterium]